MLYNNNDQLSKNIKIKIFINVYKFGSVCVYVFFFFCLLEGGDFVFGLGGEQYVFLFLNFMEVIEVNSCWESIVVKIV